MSQSTTVTSAGKTAEGSSAAPKRKLRPARKQVEHGEIDKTEGPQAGKEYNVWYNKWAGGDKEDPLNNKTLSQSRCVITRDAGYTRADATGNRYCCLFFARGCCPYGHECNFLHRLPFANQIIDHSRDCFGREKHAEYRDDMGGVGSFNRTNRTLYIGKIQESPDKDQTKETLLRHFGEWGEIIRWNILYNRGLAFITFKYEVNAQFAKEAMSNQSLDMDEILNIRWATEDPNPGEKAKEDRRIVEEGQQAISRALNEDLVEAAHALRTLEEGHEEDFYPIDASEVYPEEIDERPSKRSRPTNGSSGGVSVESKSVGGLLGGDALDNIKYYAELTRKQAQEERARKAGGAGTKATPAPGKGVAALLGGYGSGDESD